MRNFIQVLKMPFTLNRFQPGRDVKLNPAYDFVIAAPTALSFISFHLGSLRQGCRDFGLNPVTAALLLMLYFFIKTFLILLIAAVTVINSLIYIAYRMINWWPLKWLLRIFAVFWSGMVFCSLFARISADQDPCRIHMLSGVWDPSGVICGNVPLFTDSVLWIANTLIALSPVFVVLFVQFTERWFWRFNVYLGTKLMSPLQGLGEPLKFMYTVAGYRRCANRQAQAYNGK